MRPRRKLADRDMTRYLAKDEQRAMQEALRKSTRKVGRGRDLRKSEKP
jgi:hypothetical protein